MKNSLQWRLSLGLAVGVSVLWIAASMVTGSIVKQEIDEVFDGALQAAAQQLLQPVIYSLVEGREDEHEDDDDDDRPKRWTSEEHQDEGSEDHHAFDMDESLIFIARSKNGQTLLKSSETRSDLFPAYTRIGFETTQTHRIYSSTGLNGSIIVSVADPLARRQEAAYKALYALALPLLVLLPLSLLGVWFLVRRSMGPLNLFRDEIEARDGTDLTPIVAKALPSEIEPVADAVNQLMIRLQRTLQAERSFSANSAHELRTPVAAALAQTQRLIAETSEPIAKDRAEKIESALKSLADLCAKLLQLARAEGGALRSESSNDILPILSLVLEDFRSQHSRLVLELPDSPLCLKIDANAFAILARNLIENAFKHGDPSSEVIVRLSQQGHFSVINECALVPPDKLAMLTRPFERGETSANGSGVGLAIVVAIADGIGTKLQLSSPIEGKGGGFQASVLLG